MQFLLLCLLVAGLLVEHGEAGFKEVIDMLGIPMSEQQLDDQVYPILRQKCYVPEDMTQTDVMHLVANNQEELAVIGVEVPSAYASMLDPLKDGVTDNCGGSGDGGDGGSGGGSGCEAAGLSFAIAAVVLMNLQ